jgi:hypothetical protein
MGEGCLRCNRNLSHDSRAPDRRFPSRRRRALAGRRSAAPATGGAAKALLGPGDHNPVRSSSTVSESGTSRPPHAGVPRSNCRVGGKGYYRAFLNLIRHAHRWEDARQVYGKIGNPVLVVYGIATGRSLKNAGVRNLSGALTAEMNRARNGPGKGDAPDSVTAIALSRRMIVTCMWGVSDPLRAARGAKKGAAKWGRSRPTGRPARARTAITGGTARRRCHTRGC